MSSKAIERRKRGIQLLRDGFSRKQVQEMLNVPQSTLSGWAAKAFGEVGKRFKYKTRSSKRGRDNAVGNWHPPSDENPVDYRSCASFDPPGRDPTSDDTDCDCWLALTLAVMQIGQPRPQKKSRKKKRRVSPVNERRINAKSDLFPERTTR